MVVDDARLNRRLSQWRLKQPDRTVAVFGKTPQAISGASVRLV